MTVQEVTPAEFDAAVATFKEAWHRADDLGFDGHRVQYGIHALIRAGWAPLTPDDDR